MSAGTSAPLLGLVCECVCVCVCAVVVLHQAAAAAGKRYVWAVDADSDGANGMLFARLLTVIDGCVAPEPSRRPTVPQVLDTLTALLHSATAASTTGVGGSGCTSPTARGSASLTYDVLAIVDAMEALDMDAAAVIDALGGATASSLDALRAVGVPFVKCIAVKDALSGGDPAKVLSMGAAQVPQRHPGALP